MKNPLSSDLQQSQGYFGEVYPEPAEGFHFASAPKKTRDRIRQFDEDCTWHKLIVAVQFFQTLLYAEEGMTEQVNQLEVKNDYG